MGTGLPDYNGSLVVDGILNIRLSGLWLTALMHSVIYLFITVGELMGWTTSLCHTNVGLTVRANENRNGCRVSGRGLHFHEYLLHPTPPAAKNSIDYVMPAAATGTFARFCVMFSFRLWH